MKHLWANGKAERLCRRGHRVEPRGGHNFCIRHIGQSRAATWHPVIGPPHAHSASSQPPSHCHVTVRTPSQQYANSDPYYHVSICDRSVHFPCHRVRTVRIPCVTLSVVPRGTSILPNLPISSIQQNAITFSYEVRLR